MSHDAILKHRQNPPAECRIQLAGTGSILGRSGRSIDPAVWIISPTGLPISSGSVGNRCACLGRVALYSDHHQNTGGCRAPTSVTCTNQRHDDWRDCGAGHCQFSRQTIPPWLIALGEVMKLSWNMLLTACKPPNWNKCLPFWCRTGSAELMSPPD